MRHLRSFLFQWRVLLLLLLGGFLLFLFFNQRLTQESDTSPPPHDPKTPRLTLNLGKEPPTLDPLRNTDSTSGRVIHELMRGLTDFDAEARVSPELAESWTVSPDGLLYTFKLRPNLKWSDGKPLSVHDFTYAWQRVLTQANGSAYAFFLFPILNAEAFYNGTIQDFKKVGIETPDARTIRLRLKRPNVFFPAMLAFPVAVPLRRDNVEAHGSQFTEAGRYITNGPYVLSEWQHDSRIRLTANPHYWDGKASKRPTIQFEMIPDQNTALTLFEQGVLDMADSGTVISNFEYERYAQDPRAKEVGISFIQYLGFNTQKAPFNDASVRRAFCQCVQRAYFPTLLKSGESELKSFITPNLFGYNADLGHDVNVKDARQAWQTYQKKHPDVLPPPLMFTNDYAVRKIGEILQFHWKQGLGISTPLRTLDWKVYLSRLEYDTPPMFLLSWFVDYPDADSFLSLFHSTNGNNHTGWRSARYDALIEAGAMMPNSPKRQAVYDEAQRLLLEEDTAICPLFTRKKLWLNQPWIEGIRFNAMNDLVIDNVTIHPH